MTVLLDDPRPAIEDAYSALQVALDLVAASPSLAASLRDAETALVAARVEAHRTAARAERRAA